MSKVKELSEYEKHIAIVKDFTIIECKFRLMEIIKEQPSNEAAIDEIKKYILEENDES